MVFRTFEMGLKKQLEWALGYGSHLHQNGHFKLARNGPFNPNTHFKLEPILDGSNEQNGCIQTGCKTETSNPAAENYALLAFTTAVAPENKL